MISHPLFFVLVRQDAHESLRGGRLDSVVLFADGVVAFKVADVVAVSGHLHCVDRGLGGEPCYVAAGASVPQPAVMPAEIRLASLRV